MVCETQNLLTSQYTVFSEKPFNRNLCHIETSQVINANQWNGFNRHLKFNPKRTGLFRGSVG